MNAGEIILWGFASTIVLTTIMAVAKPLGISRMDIPFLLGTMFTANRNKAAFYGLVSHVVIGQAFAFLYAMAFASVEMSTWWFGISIGLVHGAFVLSAGLQVLSSFHPRMAQPYQGPTPTRQLQPPGFFAINYGKGTPVITILAHLIYGCMLGIFL